MSQKVLLSLGISAGFLLSVLAAGYFIHTSAYVMWAMVPEEPLKIFLDLGGQQQILLRHLESQYHLDRFLGVPAGSPTRLVYTRSGARESAVVLPRLRQQHLLPKTLADQGWQTKRVGLLLLARRGPAPVPGGEVPTHVLLGQALAHFTTALIKDRLPVHPVLLASLSSSALPLLSEEFRLVGDFKEDTLLLTLEQGNAWPKLPSPPSLAPPPGFALSIPGSVLPFLPLDSKDQWNQYFWQKLHLTSSQPDLISALTSFSRVQAQGTETGTTLGVIGEEENFVKLADTWVAQEVAYTHPVTRAFRLPDGTLGYEKRPAPVAAAFVGPAVRKGCRSSELSLFLCQSADQTALGTTPTAADSKVEFEPFISASWYITLSNAFTGKLALPGISGLVAWGSEKRATLALPLVVTK